MEMIYIWEIICAISAIVELFSVAIVAIWFVFGALSALAVMFLGGSEHLQVFVFLFTSFIGFFILRRLWLTKLKKNREPTNLDRNIGRTVLVIEEVNNIAATGAIKINGQYWNARAEDAETTFSVGDQVVIKQIEGSSMIVAAPAPTSEGR